MPTERRQGRAGPPVAPGARRGGTARAAGAAPGTGARYRRGRSTGAAAAFAGGVSARARARDSGHGHASGGRRFIERARGSRGRATALARARCRPHSRNFHSWRHMGQCCCTCCEFSHLRMQCMWKQCEHCPHTNGQSSPGTLPAARTHGQPRPERGARCRCRSRTHSRGSSR